MNFTVHWAGTAEEDLAQIWIAANDRDDVVAAASTIDELLTFDPLNCGESRTGNLRVAFVPPLGLDFKVFPADRIVRVLAVWRIR